MYLIISNIKCPPLSSLSLLPMAATRKLSKRRPLSIISQSQPIPQSSSEAAATFAASLPERTLSEPDPSSQANTKPPSLFRSFSLRAWRRPPDSFLPNDVSLSGRFSRWSRRRASTSAADSAQQEHQDFLPLVRVVSPFFVSMVRIPPLF